VVPVSAVLLAGLLVIAAVSRRWRVTVAAGAVLALCATIAVPTVLSHTVAPGRDDFVVMSANLEYGGADAQSPVTAAREHRVDVPVLIEITAAAVQRLRVSVWTPCCLKSVGQPSQGACGTIIRSRIPMALAQARLDQVSAQSFLEPVVSIHSRTGDVVLGAVHSRPPDPRGAGAGGPVWPICRHGVNGSLSICHWFWRGDCNASWGRSGFRGVAETMTGAHRAAGEVWAPTWPQGRRLIRPFSQLDHVLARGVSVVDAGVVHLPNTDHAVVWARLSPDRTEVRSPGTRVTRDRGVSFA
jgi:hypothetical protein